MPTTKKRRAKISPAVQAHQDVVSAARLASENVAVAAKLASESVAIAAKVANENAELVRGWVLGIYDENGKLLQPGLFLRVGRLEKLMYVGVVLAVAIFIHGYFGVDFNSIVGFLKSLL